MTAETDALTLTFNSIDDLAHACRGPHVIPWDDPAFHEDFKNDWRNRARHVVSLAAAPAVQPAAGEPVARKHSDKCWGRTSFSDEMAHCYCPRPIGWTNQVALDAARDHPKEAAWMWGAPNGSINILLYAHPPAQGSESGGEVERLRVLLDNLVIAQTLSREIRQSATDEARSYLYQLRQAALSPQPGPASEGDPAHD